MPRSPQRAGADTNVLLAAFTITAAVTGVGSFAVGSDTFAGHAVPIVHGRRFTGSHEQASHDPDNLPVTQWLTDSVPDVDVTGWRLGIRDAGGARRELRQDELLAMPAQTVDATIDCTGGWWSSQSWT